jgi:hypothetical protein
MQINMVARVSLSSALMTVMLLCTSALMDRSMRLPSTSTRMVRARVMRAAIGPMALTLNNTQRALAYACSEMGEVTTLSTDGATKPVNGATVLVPGTTIAHAETHVVSVHPQIGNFTG